MDDTTFADYCNLLTRLDRFNERLRIQFGKSIICGPGCMSCCRQVLELLPVEFEHLQTRAKEACLPERVVEAGVCPLLDAAGTCLLYEHRPVICRTHGMPLLVEENGLQRVDCCPENFRDIELSTLPGGSMLHLERVNLLLISINHVFASACGIDPGQRISIAHIFSQAGLSQQRFT